MVKVTCINFLSLYENVWEYQPKHHREGSRIFWPKKLREQIKGDELILSKGFESFVFGYDKEIG